MIRSFNNNADEEEVSTSKVLRSEFQWKIDIERGKYVIKLRGPISDVYSTYGFVKSTRKKMKDFPINQKST